MESNNHPSDNATNDSKTIGHLNLSSRNYPIQLKWYKGSRNRGFKGDLAA